MSELRDKLVKETEALGTELANDVLAKLGDLIMLIARVEYMNTTQNPNSLIPELNRVVRNALIKGVTDACNKQLENSNDYPE
jgi:hypothetical protein